MTSIPHSTATPKPRAATRVVTPPDRTVHAATSTRLTDSSWRLLGVFGVILALIGAADILLQWYPATFGSPEWEFGTIAVTLGSLPVLTLGLAAMQASFLARGSRRGTLTVALGFAVLALVVAAAYLLFLLNVPVVLKSASGPAVLAVQKAIVCTSVMGLGFGVGFVSAAVLSFRAMRGMRDV
jgi:hypothetical protein